MDNRKKTNWMPWDKKNKEWHKHINLIEAADQKRIKIEPMHSTCMMSHEQEQQI
jgi:hypothetical protein